MGFNINGHGVRTPEQVLVFFLTKMSRTNERNKKSKSVFTKPKCYKDESDKALTGNLKGTALTCVMAKKQYQRDTD